MNLFKPYKEHHQDERLLQSFPRDADIKLLRQVHIIGSIYICTQDNDKYIITDVDKYGIWGKLAPEQVQNHKWLPPHPHNGFDLSNEEFVEKYLAKKRLEDLIYPPGRTTVQYTGPICPVCGGTEIKGAPGLKRWQCKKCGELFS